MTDFHHSLDRALDEGHPYAWTLPADTSIVDNFPRTESADHQQQLDDSLWDMALEEAVAYDGFGAPLYAHQIPAEGTE